jgi:hypothetical protein
MNHGRMRLSIFVSVPKLQMLIGYIIIMAEYNNKDRRRASAVTDISLWPLAYGEYGYLQKPTEARDLFGGFLLAIFSAEPS